MLVNVLGLKTANMTLSPSYTWVVLCVPKTPRASPSQEGGASYQRRGLTAKISPFPSSHGGNEALQ